jgi:D-alanyl-D-alanine carboxypeptidase
MKYWKLLIILPLLVFQGIRLSGQFNKAKLDSLLDVYEQKNKLMATLAISYDQNIVYKRAIGYKWYEGAQKIKSDPLTKYRIGSITKTFTSVMILQLIEEKKIKLTTTLSKFFPRFPNAKKITIEHLIKHRSGIHNFTDDPEYLTYMLKPITRDELMQIFIKLPSDFEPGTMHAYSNTNYVLLGMIIEKLTKGSYQEALTKRITNPLGLQNTYCGASADLNKNEARSYLFDGNDWVFENETDMSVPLGAGMIVSTAEDLTKFVEGIFTYQLLRKETVDEMIIQQDGYGMGIFSIPFYETIAYGHNGKLDGFQSMMAYFPNEKLSIAFSANGVNTDANEFLVGILSIYFNKPYTIPVFYTFHVPENILKEYSGIYHSEMLHLDFYISMNGNVIVGEAAGQSSFPLEAKSETKFEYAPAGLEIEFKRNIANMVESFVLKQTGMEFSFIKLK